jgi:hypothetical protein
MKSINISSFLNPTQVQADITMVGSFVISMVSPATKTAVHDIAEGLLQLSEAAVTVAEIDALIADAKVSVPPADAAIFGLLLNGSVAILNLMIAKFDTKNPEVVAYADGIANGILDAGF